MLICSHILYGYFKKCLLIYLAVTGLTGGGELFLEAGRI